MRNPPAKVVRAVLVAIWLLIAGVALISTVSDSPVRLPFQNRLAIQAVLPEGWAFFTRDPREANPVAYVAHRGRWEAASVPNSHPRHLFGLRREARVQGSELALLLRGVPASAWQAVAEPREFPDPRAAPSRTIENFTTRAHLCGRVLVRRSSPIPWAWSRHASSIAMPAEEVLLQVECG